MAAVGVGKDGLRAVERQLAVGVDHDIVADLAAVIERHVIECAATGSGGRPVSLFGHSFGGNVALALADLRPELVSAVAVYESPMSWPSVSLTRLK